EAARSGISERFGTCDILVNGAGGNNPSASTDDEYLDTDKIDDPNVKDFFELDTEGIDFVFKLNFLGTLIPSQVFGSDMATKEHATVINISSMNAYTPLTKIPAYSDAKSSVTNFTQWLSVYLSKTGVRVNDRIHKIISATTIRSISEPEEILGTQLYHAEHRASGLVTDITISVE